MKNIITQEDIQDIQKKLDEIQEDINKITLLQEQLKKVINKPIEKITNEEIALFEEFENALKEVEEKRYNLPSSLRTFENAISEWKTMKETYPLVDENEFVSSEEKKNLNCAEEIMNQHNEQEKTISSIKKLYDVIRNKIVAKEDKEWIDRKSEEVKDTLLEPQEDSSCVIMVYGDNSETISSKELALIKAGILPPPGYVTYEDFGPHGDYTREVYHPYSIESLEFIPYSEATLEQKQQIRAKEKKLKDIIKSKDSKYHKKGTAFIKTTRDKNAYGKKRIPIETTPQELAEAGLLYDEYEFKPSRKISPREIAVACNCYALTREESSGIKGFINKLKEVFRGKGEK